MDDAAQLAGCDESLRLAVVEGRWSFPFRVVFVALKGMHRGALSQSCESWCQRIHFIISLRGEENVIAYGFC